jgi:hypothetical protein
LRKRPDPTRDGAFEGLFHKLLDSKFDVVSELASIMPNELNAVVWKWVVRSRNDDPQSKLACARSEGDCRRRCNTNCNNIDSGGIESGGKGHSKHRPRFSRVSPDHDAARAAYLNQISTRGHSEAQRHFGG